MFISRRYFYIKDAADLVFRVVYYWIFNSALNYTYIRRNMYSARDFFRVIWGNTFCRIITKTNPRNSYKLLTDRKTENYYH